MNKLITIAAAGAIAIVASFSATAPSSAFYHGGPGIGLAAGFIGLAAGAAIASSAEDDQYYRDDRGADMDWRDHVAACEDAYQSYSPRSDSFVGMDGYRHRCEI
jgi:hypothetical protein